MHIFIHRITSNLDPCETLDSRQNFINQRDPLKFLTHISHVPTQPFTLGTHVTHTTHEI